MDKRRLLLRLLDMANIPEDELGDYDRADALARELEPMMEPPGGATGEALSLMARLPLAAINAHQDVLLRWLNHDHDGSCGQYKALVALKRLPPATLAQQPSVKEDTERLYRSKGRGYFEIEIRELAKQIGEGFHRFLGTCPWNSTWSWTSEDPTNPSRHAACELRWPGIARDRTMGHAVLGRCTYRLYSCATVVQCTAA